MRFMSEDNTGTTPASETTWDAEAYAANTAHHRRHDNSFLSSTPLGPSMTVVDVGCGSGDFTRTLAETVPQGTVIGVDPQKDLVALAAQGAHPNQRFLIGGARDLAELIEPSSVDAVASRAALHWLPRPDHPVALEGMCQILRPGGCLRIEMGGAGNITRVAELLGAAAEKYGGPRHPWTFPTDVEYRSLIESAGFEIGERGFVRLEPQRRPFDESSFLGWLESQVLNAFESGFDEVRRRAFRSEVVARWGEMSSDGQWDQLFVRLQVLAFKPA
jgi:trans-aconitate 2-methyltransferase